VRPTSDELDEQFMAAIWRELIQRPSPTQPVELHATALSHPVAVALVGECSIPVV
jgi:hypothetical protein